MWFFVLVLIVVAAAFVLPRLVSGSRSTENPNANDPDAFEADLDPEGDEPQGY